MQARCTGSTPAPRRLGLDVTAGADSRQRGRSGLAAGARAPVRASTMSPSGSGASSWGDCGPIDRSRSRSTSGTAKRNASSSVTRPSRSASAAPRRPSRSAWVKSPCRAGAYSCDSSSPFDAKNQREARRGRPLAERLQVDAAFDVARVAGVEDQDPPSRNPPQRIEEHAPPDERGRVAPPPCATAATSAARASRGTKK